MVQTSEFQVGDYVVPDGWQHGGENLIESDGYSDGSFPGCQFRLPSIGGNLAVNLTRTGKDHWTKWTGGKKFRCRVKIEFVGDGEPSAFTYGWLYHDRM